MIEHAVVIVGGGPTGLMLAGELALAGLDAVVVERRTSEDLVGSRAGGLHSRTIEILDQRGIADRFLAEGQKAQVRGYVGAAGAWCGPCAYRCGLDLLGRGSLEVIPGAYASRDFCLKPHCRYPHKSKGHPSTYVSPITQNSTCVFSHRLPRAECQPKAQHQDKRISGNHLAFVHQAQALGNSERAFQSQRSHRDLAQIQ
jgi:FAD binding domain